MELARRYSTQGTSFCDLYPGVGRKEDSPLTSEVTLTCASVKSFTHNYFQYHQATGMASRDTSKQSADTVHRANPPPCWLCILIHIQQSATILVRSCHWLCQRTRGLGVILGDSCFSKSIFKEGLVFTFF